MAASGVLVAGLPDSCKTTFLAALWHLIVSEEVETKLRLRELGGVEYAHLNRLASAWQRALPQERTKLAAGLGQVRMSLLDETDKSIDIHFPDISGEHFENAWSQRALPRVLADYVCETDSTLLFVNPAQVRQPVTVEQIRAQHAALGDVPHPEPEANWDPKLSPTQVVLVDIMQAIDGLRRTSDGDVSIIVSAWDTTGDQWLSAHEYVERELPMLHQYLSARRSSAALPYRAYGVSAQGGELPNDRNELLAKKIASHRIKVVEPSSAHHDLTSIVFDLLQPRN